MYNIDPMTPLENIDERTPKVVLHDILHRSRYRIGDDVNSTEYIRQMVRTIRSILPFTFSKDTRNVVKILKTFFGVEEDWDYDQLMKLYVYWEDLKNTIRSKNLIAFQEGNRPTLNNPYILNPTFTYAFCYYHGISVPFDISYDSMKLIVRLYIIGPHSVPRSLDIIQRYIANANVEDILSLVSHIPSKHLVYPNIEVIDPPTHEDLMKISKSRIGAIPKNSHEAIYLGGTLYGFNLFLCNDPMFEYCNLSNYFHKHYPHFDIHTLNSLDLYEDMMITYISYDENIKRLLSINPKLVTLNVYEPRFPLEIYPRCIFNRLIRDSGYHRDNQKNEYEYIQEMYYSNSFYHGRYDNIKNDRTPIHFSEFIDIDINDLITFGSQSDMSMIMLSSEEIYYMFETYKTFSNKFVSSGDDLTQDNIQQLISICEIHKPFKFREILNLIEFIKRRNELLATSFVWIHEQMNDTEIRDKIDKALKGLIDLGMYMRGWNGGSEYPLQASQITDPSVFIHTSEALGRFDHMIEELGEIGTKIMELPLYSYNGEFEKVDNDEEGLTLRDRFRIVRQGEDTNNTFSCIRLSGSRYVTSGYKYRTLLNLDPLFDLKLYAPMS